MGKVIKDFLPLVFVEGTLVVGRPPFDECNILPMAKEVLGIYETMFITHVNIRRYPKTVTIAIITDRFTKVFSKTARRMWNIPGTPEALIGDAFAYIHKTDFGPRDYDYDEEDDYLWESIYGRTGDD